MRATKKVELETIVFDKRYQRPINISWLKSLVKKWDNDAAAPPLIGRRPNGVLVCIDGQHGIKACLERGDRFGYCRVVDVPSVKREAELFRMCNKERKTVSPYSKFRAAITEGNKIAKAIANAAKRAGCKIKAGGTKYKIVCCVGELEKIERRKPGSVFEVLSVISAVKKWDGHDGAFTKDIVGGVAKFYYDENPERARLIRALGTKSVDWIVNQVPPARGGGNQSAGNYAAVIAAIYRKQK